MSKSGNMSRNRIMIGPEPAVWKREAEPSREVLSYWEAAERDLLEFEATETADRMKREFNNLQDDINSFDSLKLTDAKIHGAIKELRAEGISARVRAETVKDIIISLLEAAPTIAGNVGDADEYDAIEEMVNRWTGYLTYYKITTPACLLPLAP